jgi:hypothetical protein
MSIPTGAVAAGYQAMHGLSPPLLSNGEAGGRRLPSTGSWASQLQERALAGAATPELMFPETTAGHIAEVRACHQCPQACCRDHGMCDELLHVLLD